MEFGARGCEERARQIAQGRSALRSCLSCDIYPRESIQIAEEICSSLPSCSLLRLSRWVRLSNTLTDHKAVCTDVCGLEDRSQSKEASRCSDSAQVLGEIFPCYPHFSRQSNVTFGTKRQFALDNTSCKNNFPRAGQGRLLLQESMDDSTTQALPPASNTSLAVPTLTYQLAGPAMATSPGPGSIGSQIADLTKASQTMSSNGGASQAVSLT